MKRVQICIKCLSERELVIIKDRRYYREREHQKEAFIELDHPGYWVRKIFSPICVHEWVVKNKKQRLL